MGYFIITLLVVAIGFAAWRLCEPPAKTDDSQRKLILTIKQGVPWAIAVILGVFTLTKTAYQVPTGHVGIVYTFGAITGQRNEGLQWIGPWQQMKSASVQVQGHTFRKLAAFSNETQEVFVDATINVRVSPLNIQKLYRDVGPEYFTILVQPRVFQAFKDETVKYTSIDIAPHRESIRRTVREKLTKELEAQSIAVEDLLLDNIDFSPKFKNAIEEKQSQSQLALAEREKVAGEKAKADQEIEKARGTAQAVLVNAEKQAEANRKLAESITPTYIQYLFASKLAPNVSVMMVPSGQQFIMSPEVFKKK